MCITIEELEETLDKKLLIALASINKSVEKIEDENKVRDSKITDITTKMDTLNEELSSIKNKNEELQEALAEQTDRSMRNTLVIRGVKEEENENWKKTEERVSTIISRHLQKDYNRTINMFQRVHRGNGDDRKTIYANFYSWKNAQEILTEFTNLRINNPKMKIKIDQMYSKDTMTRRNNALIERKKLLADKDSNIVKAHLVYPAKLMVKYNGSQKYELYQKF